MIIKEYRKPFKPVYEYFAHYNIKLNYYDSEAEDNLFELVQSLFDCYSIKLTPKGIDVIVHSEEMNYIDERNIEDVVGEYEDTYTFTVTSLPVPNVYEDSDYYWIPSNELLSKEEVSELWSNDFVGYEDYDDDYANTFNAFVRQCVEGRKMKLVQWISNF